MKAFALLALSLFATAAQAEINVQCQEAGTQNNVTISENDFGFGSPLGIPGQLIVRTGDEYINLKVDTIKPSLSDINLSGKNYSGGQVREVNINIDLMNACGVQFLGSTGKITITNEDGTARDIMLTNCDQKPSTHIL